MVAINKGRIRFGLRVLSYFCEVKEKQMPVKDKIYQEIVKALPSQVTLVAVSKTKPITDIQEMMALGHADFGENYVQELLTKQQEIQGNIRWHFIGHLQTNKVKQIVPFVYLVHSVDSEKLLAEVDKQARKVGRVVDCLLQVYIAQEDTKYGLDKDEVLGLIANHARYEGVRIRGLMGMASLTANEDQVRSEYRSLNTLFQQIRSSGEMGDAFDTLSMGMSGDYKIAVEEGSTMVRIGSLLFGERNYNKV